MLRQKQFEGTKFTHCIVIITENYDMIEVSKCRINLPISCSTYKKEENPRKVTELRWNRERIFTR